MKDAHATYRAQKPAAPEAEALPGPRLAMESRELETGHGPTVLVSSGEETAETPMVLISAALLRRLLAAARAMGRPKRPPRRVKRRRVDIRV